MITVALFIYFTVTIILTGVLMVESLQSTKAEREEFPSVSDAVLMILVWPGVALLLAFGLTLILLHTPKED